MEMGFLKDKKTTKHESAELEYVEGLYKALKGSFTPEQFGVFLNMHSWEVEGNYAVVFHEHYHHWQSIFTPYGHLKWGCERSASTEIIQAWLKATQGNPSQRSVPAASIIPCTDLEALSGISQILMYDTLRQIISLSEQTHEDPWLKKILEVDVAEACPQIDLHSGSYSLNGIDILEGYAKFQESIFVYMLEGKSLSEVIDIKTLQPRYYSALYYFFDKIGPERILEFPIACELALSSSKLCKFDPATDWKANHPAWRFIRIIDIIAQYDSSDCLCLDNVKENYLKYAEKTLHLCGYSGLEESWKEPREYASQGDLNIPQDMLRAITFKQEYPWVLSFPFCDTEVFRMMQTFHPYYYITSDSSGYAVPSKSFGNEVLFENHYQSFAHQICGYMSPRCLDCSKLQCGLAYYGIKGCQYQLSGKCDGHLDQESKLPNIVLDENSNLIEGCSFEMFLSLMDIKIQDLNISKISQKIVPDILTENIRRLKMDS